jgi:hypothetical protein
MTFQSSVRFDTGSGIPGEFAYDGPRRAEPGILQAAATIGAMFVSEDPANPGFWSPGKLANSQRYGLLTSPKQFASYGTTAGGPLAPTMILPANAEAEITSMGQVWAVTSTANSKPGDVVYMTNATGAITTTAPGAAAPANSTLIPGATVAPKPGSAAASLIVITLTGPLATA